MAEQRPFRVGVIGAGLSGIVTATHLLEAGIEVTVFERLPEPGGTWVFDERTPNDPRFPSTLASKGEDYAPGVEQDLKFFPPSACYQGLTNNVSTKLLQTTAGNFPPGTPDFVRHDVLLKHIQNLARTTGVDSRTVYRTRITNACKVGKVWRLSYSTAKLTGRLATFSSISGTRDFDAVVVASGHHNAPRVPDITGLREWKVAWPDRISHSKSYRTPDQFRGKNVLLIGASTSSLDIAREIGPLAHKIYQSSRGGRHDFTAKLLPENGTRVGAVSSFDGVFTGKENAQELSIYEPIPFTVTLQSGQQLCNIDYIIVCTGYHITFPFLLHLHEDHTPVEQASNTVLVTDGRRVHNLYKHIFYIPDPTLAFVGLPYHVSTWNLYDFQAITVASVFSGRAVQPSEKEMRDNYQAWLRFKNGDKDVHSLDGDEETYVQDLLDWINRDATSKGLPNVPGHTRQFHLAKADYVRRMASALDQRDGKTSPAFLVSYLPSCT